MSLAQFRDFLAQHGVKLTLTPEGKIKPTAGQPPAPEVVAQIRAGILAHRAQLLADLASPPTTSSAPDTLRKLDIQPLTPGICASCAHWQALEGWGWQMGRCGAPLRYFAPGDGPGQAISAAHHCPSVGGAAWVAAGLTPTKLDISTEKTRYPAGPGAGG